MDVITQQQIQELKVLNDIRSLLMKMDLIKTRDVLASDDLYPPNSSPDLSCNKRRPGESPCRRRQPVRSQSVHHRSSTASERMRRRDCRNEKSRQSHNSSCNTSCKYPYWPPPQRCLKSLMFLQTFMIPSLLHYSSIL